MTREDLRCARDEWISAQPDVHRLDKQILREIEVLAAIWPDRPRRSETAADYAVRWQANASARDGHRRRLASLKAERNALYKRLAEQFAEAVKQVEGA